MLSLFYDVDWWHKVIRLAHSDFTATCTTSAINSTKKNKEISLYKSQ